MKLTPRSSYCFISRTRTTNAAVSVMTSPWHTSFQFIAEITLLLCMASTILLTKIKPTGNSNNCIYYWFLAFRNKCLKVAKKTKCFPFHFENIPNTCQSPSASTRPLIEGCLVVIFTKLSWDKRNQHQSFLLMASHEIYIWPNRNGNLKH